MSPVERVEISVQDGVEIVVETGAKPKDVRIVTDGASVTVNVPEAEIIVRPSKPISHEGAAATLKNGVLAIKIRGEAK